MPRTIKTGMDYFAVDTIWDRKMKLFKAKYGLRGVGLIIELWKWIYNEGYYIIWDEETETLFSDEHKIDVEKLSEMMVYAIEKGLFRIFYTHFRIVITSSGIQKRYFEACLKRSEVHFVRDFLLFEPKKPEWSKVKIVYDSFIGVSESKISILESKIGIYEPKKGISDTKGSKGSKGKERKGKKVKEHVEASPSASPAEINSPLQKQNTDSNEPPDGDNSALVKQQLERLANKLRVENPDEYSKLIQKHPELEEDVPFPAKPP